MATSVTFSVEGMNCGSCVNKIKGKLSGYDIDQVEVDLSDKSVVIVDSKDHSAMKVKGFIEEAGFKVVGMKKG